MTPPGRTARTSRRSFLRTVSLAVAGGGLVRSELLAAETPATAVKSFQFLVVNDIHHATPECTPFVDALVAQMRGHGQIEFCLLVGDLADQGSGESMLAVREAFSALGAPVHPVPGNHDCDIGENTAIYSEVFPGKLNYSFAHEGWQFVGLDSTDGNKWQETRLGTEAEAFLDATLPRLDRDAPTVLFTHFPMAADVRMASLSSESVLSRFAALNLRCVFSGHFHAQTERAHGTATLLTNTCCSRVRGPHDGTTDEGYLLCTAHADGRLERQFVPFEPAVTLA